MNIKQIAIFILAISLRNSYVTLVTSATKSSWWFINWVDIHIQAIDPVNSTINITKTHSMWYIFTDYFEMIKNLKIHYLYKYPQTKFSFAERPTAVFIKSASEITSDVEIKLLACVQNEPVDFDFNGIEFSEGDINVIISINCKVNTKMLCEYNEERYKKWIQYFGPKNILKKEEYKKLMVTNAGSMKEAPAQKLFASKAMLRAKSDLIDFRNSINEEIEEVDIDEKEPYGITYFDDSESQVFV